MAGAGSYARGDGPRSVPDPDKAGYDSMTAEQRSRNEAQERQASSKGYWQQHPGVGESLVPVWGSAREAIADAHDGDIVGATANAALAITDLAPGTFVVKGLTKGGAKLAGSHSWKITRRWMGDQGMLSKGQHGHHGIIPRGGWGKHIPDAVKNQPWNITAMPNAVTHGRIHGSYKGQPQYGQIERYWRGAPDWAKAAHVWAPSGTVTAVDSHQERKKPR